MYILNVYIGGSKVELFKDENVTLNSSVQNINDLSKVFTDYTQSFTIPASQVNNKLFEHWYNADITGGFDASVRAAATLELNYMPFKSGVIQLESATLKNGEVYSYKITFFSDVVKLSDLFGNDYMSELTLTAYDHDSNGANVLLGLIGTSLVSGNITYPAWFKRNVNVDSNGTSLSGDDILNTGGFGIKFNELNAGIRVNRLIDSIESKYGITFSSDFFVNSNHTEEMYLFLRSAKGLIIGDEATTTTLFDNIVTTDGNYSAVTGKYTYTGTATISHTIAVTPNTSFLDVEYTVALYKNATLVDSITSTGNTTFTIGVAGVSTDTTEVKITYSNTFYFNASFINDNIEVNTAAPFTLVANVSISKNMPKLKVKDFINYLFKMFNLVIIPTSSTTFDVLPLSDWYTAGGEIDITKYVDLDSVSITRPNLNKYLNMGYKPTETVIGNAFFENNNITYGNIENSFTFDGGTLDITTGFENLVAERLTKVNDKTLTDVHVGKLLNSDLEEIMTKPLLYYNNGGYSLDDNIGFYDETTTKTSQGTINEITQYYSTTNSLNWGAEISTFSLTAQTTSLYSSYWSSYITDLYNTKRRVYKFTAIIPHHIFSAINLNDKLIIRDRKYIINKMKANLTNGKVQLELLNDV